MYAYVYEVANLDEEPSQTNSTIRPLLNLFEHQRNPSLSYRVQVAVALAETVLQLHTAGWLHKGIRSENVLFLDRDKLCWEIGNSLGPYLAGYDYSRADNPLEMTEDAPQTSNIDVYRHPQAQGAARPSFNKSFDLYALECVLLEIALWKKLQDILFQAGSVPDTQPENHVTTNADELAHLRWDAVLRGRECLLDMEKSNPLLDEVAFRAGNTYAKVVKICFTAGQDQDNEETETSVITQISIVKLLEQLKY